MKKLHEVSLLIDAYGRILTKKQYECVTQFYFDDLSLAEIAVNQNSTRAAVYNNITKAIKELLDLELKLKLVKKNHQRKEVYGEINDQAISEKLIKIDKE